MNLRNRGLRTTAAAATIGVCLAGGIAFAAANEDDPDAGLTPEQRDATYKSLQSKFDKDYAAWLASDFVKSLDLSKLPRTETSGDAFIPPYTSVEEASDHADLAVTGTVTSIKLIPYATVTEFAVDDSAGAAPPTVTVVQGSALYPEKGFKTAYIGEPGSQTMLLPGDEAMLLLNEAPPATQEMADSAANAEGGTQAARESTRAYRIQPFTGEYKVKKGKTEKIKDTQVKDADGKSKKELLDRIKKHKGSL